MTPKIISAKFWLLMCILCFGFQNTKSQDLLKSRNTSYFTYIFKLSDKEAKEIYKEDVWTVDTTFLHTLVDSFPTDNQYTRRLPVGHYLRVFSEKEKLQISVTTVQDFEVIILNNNTDLCIQVIDLQGNVIEDAKVKVRSKGLKFNDKAKLYIDRKSNQKGLLKVTYKGFTAYYNLNRSYNNSAIKRGTRKVVYGTPIKYVWIPINFIIYLPIDGVKSIINGWPQGTIYRSVSFFTDFPHRISNLFDRDNYYNSDKKHKGYLVFNKPKYQPGDTVKFKAFLVNKNGKPVNKTLGVELQTFNKNIELTLLKPYRKGGYEYQFYLHDSLQLKLDRNYNLTLETDDDEVYMSGSFKYEDYELSKINLNVNLTETKQYKGTPFTLKVKGTDENDLNLMGARVEILVRPGNIQKFFSNNVFFPDTLLYIEKELEPTDETEIIIADSTFPELNFEYNMEVKLVTSDNNIIFENRKVPYFFKSDEFRIESKADSIVFKFEKNGISINKPVTIEAFDDFANKTPIFQGSTPVTVPLNAYYAYYSIATDSLYATFELSTQPTLLQCFSERTDDSVFFMVDNPRNIPFSYTVYKRKNRTNEGYGDSLDLKISNSTKKDYLVSIRYLWGGKVREENYKVPLMDKKLNISVLQPKIVYPGQKANFELVVTDYKGNPVEGVDLTAYSLTKKFSYSPPTLPYMGESRKNKPVINNFRFDEHETDQNLSLKLNYETWKLLAGLDTIEYYKFLYPENKLYRFEYFTPDFQTQFAPFVMHDGENQPIHVIYVDSKPVYFSWSTIAQPYSILIDSGYHQIKLRTSYKSITIDNVHFAAGKKVIFSINDNWQNRSLKIEDVKPELSEYEQQLLYKYIFPYRNTFGERLAFVEQNNSFQLLSNPIKRNTRLNLAGPIVANFNFTLIDSFSTAAFHEPLFEYDFASGLLKMRSVDAKILPKNLQLYGEGKGLTDMALTKTGIYRIWDEHLALKRYSTARYNYPTSTKSGNGRMLFSINYPVDTLKKQLLNVIVFKSDDHEFMRIYPGNNTVVHDLAAGFYKLLFFYPGSNYHVEDSILIKPNGLNYYEFKSPVELKKDTFSITVNRIIDETIFKPVTHYVNEGNELKQIYNMYQQQFQYNGQGVMVEGFVYDMTNTPIPGANVVVKGTTYGTVTDLDGHYSLKVPSGNNILVFTFIGYISEEIAINYNNIVNCTLTEDITNLDEVVVIGYGVQKRTQITASMSTVSTQSLLGGIPDVENDISQSLQGRVAGVEITTNSGSPGGSVQITIRGASSFQFENPPLYIINGSVYTGDIAELDPSLIETIKVLKGEEAAIYGAKGINGVVIIQTKAGLFKPTSKTKNQLAGVDDVFFESASKASSIRENFSDYAFWQPKLYTNSEGKANFEVTFPDDVTSWDTYYLAMNGKSQTGQAQSLIKSFKPLMAQLAVPRFMVQSDTSYAIAKVLNYTDDSVQVVTKFELNGVPQYSKSAYCKHSIIDTLFVTATDSVKVKYYLKKTDGYFDGEQKEIAVFPIGIEESVGRFYVLNNDTTLQLAFDTIMGDVTLFARADILEVLEDEISQLIDYKYSCNEQLASKLKALLADSQIAKYKGNEFNRTREIDKMIRLLIKNQKESGLWGWWKDSRENEWISLHVLEALIQAKKAGYSVKLNEGKIIETLIWSLENSTDFNARVRILNILKLLNAQISYGNYIADLTRTKDLSLNMLLNITLLKQQCNLKCDLDTLAAFQKSTLFGNFYYSKELKESSLLINDIQNTLLVYKILKLDTVNHEDKLLKIRNYFMECRRSGYWANTFESAQILETILPDLMGDKSKLEQPSITIKGEDVKTISKFPFELKTKANQSIEITKKGSFPIYLTAYQKYWNTKPKANSNEFEITTHFENASEQFLNAGKEVVLVANVTVKKDAEFVMINIPIPGGCSYSDKKVNFRFESHREYFRNETAIFCEHLPKGKYQFEVKLLPKFTGSYTINPAKIELMYFPTFRANNALKRIKIK